MNAVKYIPIGNTKIVVDGVTYQNVDGKTAVLPADKMGEAELKNLLERRFIRKLELDDAGTSSPTGKPKKQPPEGNPQDTTPQV